MEPPLQAVMAAIEAFVFTLYQATLHLEGIILIDQNFHSPTILFIYTISKLKTQGNWRHFRKITENAAHKILTSYVHVIQ